MSVNTPSDGAYYDVLIVGGGPAGCATAAALAGQGVRSLLIDRGDVSRGPAVESLPPSVRESLIGLGLWDAFQSSKPIDSPGVVSAWGTSEQSETDFLFQPGGCGWHAERSSYRAAMARSLQSAGTTVLLRCRLLHVTQQTNQQWRVILRDDSDVNSPRCLTVRTTMLVDATGHTAALATRLGARRNRIDRLIAIVSAVPVQTDFAVLDQRLWLEATRDGWWYSVPWRDGRLIAYMTDVEHLPSRRAEWPNWWQAAWNRTQLLKPRQLISHPPPLRLLPAITSRLDRFAGSDWLAVGDAAYTLDPLSGQGVQSSLTSGYLAAEAICASLRGEIGRLGDYAAGCERRFQVAMRTREEYYNQPGPWRESFFWTRRTNSSEQ